MKSHFTHGRSGSGLATLALSVVLAGCAPLTSQTARPPLPVATDWPTEVSQDTPGTAPVELSWRTYVAYPPLQALIETALVNNRDLRLALLRVEEARASYAIQRSDQFPTLGIDAQGGRARVPGDLNYFGQSAVSGDYRADVGLSSWELDLWGRVRSLKDAALQEYLATDQAQRAVRATLIAEVAHGYLGLRELDERLALTRQTIATREESYRIYSRRTEVGSASVFELTQVETLLIQARTLATQLEQARAAQANALGLLLGAPVELPPIHNTEVALRDEAVFTELRVGLPAELLTARPDIAAAEHRLVAANANIHAARAAFFPRIALTGSWGSASTELDGLFEGGSRAWSFMPTISLPIFDGGRRRAGLDLAEVRSDMAVASYEQTIQTAFREVADALSARQWLGQQVGFQREAVDVQTRRARLAQLRYDSGAVTFLEVLDAQRDLLDAQQQLMQVRRSLLDSHVSLYAALGGGSAEPDISTSTP
ncbi:MULTISPECIES: efflux transporter outer membrane subunit [Pseudomonas]|uniref:Efflux transporter outer membrane subunit n=1 Tax=Pseudomonas helleri TaxID=1608996 RepID=A0A6L5HVI1_9PSED|nr:MULTISPECIES: efflux transporter outer membrane subunit [Pseudomonas]MQT47890.1 efflux transporter outer membrane subunit [Pseudomonas helleri]MQT60253.1 efflux transporter outer membrane subunit [Pseudomonas sp. FSL R10-0399]MQT88741.1 efflux transporter outer membrane subunit [Pseudomonas helleri]MQU06445.1 efflux transporter outer membrane subunit [Pseudomonas helleri]